MFIILSNLEKVTNITLTTGDGSTSTELKGNNNFFIKKNKGFKLITEFVIVSE